MKPYNLLLSGSGLGETLLVDRAGQYNLFIEGNFNGGTVFFEFLSANGVTWIALPGTTTAKSFPLFIPEDIYIRARTSGGTPSIRVWIEVAEAGREIISFDLSSYTDTQEVKDLIATSPELTAAVAAAQAAQASAASSAAQATGLLADSTTSNTVAASGDKTFTVQSGKLFVAGLPMRVSSKANPDTQFMTGVVKSYSGTTLVFSSSAATGSATRTDWTLAVTGGAMSPVGATQDTQALTRYSEKLDGLRGALISSSRPNILLDFLDNTYFVRGAYAGASMLALIAATPGSFFSRASTATYIGSNGLMQTAAVHEPRFEYDPVTLLPLGLLIEPARTNLFINSEAFVGIGGSAVTVSSNVSAGPDGLNTMDRIIEDAVSGEHFPVERAISLTAGTVYAYSIYVRAAPSANRSLRLRIASFTEVSVAFDPMTGTLSNPLGTGYLSSGFTNMGGGLYRVWIVFTAQATTTSVARAQLLASGASFYLGDGASGIDIGFAQFEAGNSPSSYIPTGGSSVTRSGEDYVFVFANGLMPRAQGAMFTEFRADTPASSNNIAARFDNGAVPTDQLYFARNSASGGPPAAVAIAASATILSSTGGATWPGDGIARAALRYAPNDVTRSWLGTTPISVTGFTLFDGLNRVVPSARASLHLRRLAFFPGALTNTELQAITTAATWN